jgi:branched-chain amino acid transport system ATP-binding protein
MSEQRDPLLQVRNATVAFGGVVAVNDVSVDVAPGEIVGLVGPNGAGKSTLFGAIAGAVPLRSGTIRFAGEDVTRRRALQMSRRGVARTFQKVRLFSSLSADDNVLVAARAHDRSAARARRRAQEALDLAGFSADRRGAVGSLPLADRKRVEIARGLAADPSLLLLDEMMNGLTSEETSVLTSAIKSLPAEGVTVILVEHVLQVVRALCDRLVVLHHGRLIADGEPAAVLAREDVAEAWLGTTSGDRSG